jgi:hypothetical protein
MFSRSKKIRFPLWKFLNQPVFNPDVKTVFNPRVFWRLHMNEVLKRCLEMDVTSSDGRRE